MGGLFSKPKKVSMPPVKPVEPLPTPELMTEEAKAEEARKGRRRRGRAKTIVTGELEPETTAKTRLLGG